MKKTALNHLIEMMEMAPVPTDELLKRTHEIFILLLKSKLSEEKQQLKDAFEIGGLAQKKDTNYTFEQYYNGEFNGNN